MLIINHPDSKNRALVAEIVGPAGAGKSTLLRTLSQRNDEFRASVPLTKVRYILPLIENTLFLLPSFLRYYRRSRWFTWAETRSMIYLKAWHQELTRQEASSDPLTIMDQGPIFRLVLLREFGPEFSQSPRFEEWWRRIFKQWAAILDSVIWLDAPNALLKERIRTRSVWHRTKEKSEEEIYSFLTRYRTSYEQIIAELPAHLRQTLLCFDTSQESSEQIANKVLTAFDLELNID